ncbi:helix-turn-helix domain-containing protein [Bdellovibrio bacteriovorus]|uniref:helix-turn-helix transcriptional regulator n=1 Tax=Bdellovibrio bacteriovorus TaxID=959 RepID=UPI0021CFE7D5|nr:helix-turn-helix transcriptional regulator [Bdellovibrio bacteriovorus]UXR63788.1 helix-turn-helix domain-containing protein [Bdellovibrio bacteriovorus]
MHYVRAKYDSGSIQNDELALSSFWTISLMSSNKEPTLGTPVYGYCPPLYIDILKVVRQITVQSPGIGYPHMSTKSLPKLLEKELGPISFGGFLRSARTLKELSQTDMAKLLDLSKSTLCDIEKGRQNVSIELAAKIAKKCGLSEVLAVECAIHDSLKRAGLKMEIKVRKPS